MCEVSSLGLEGRALDLKGQLKQNEQNPDPGRLVAVIDPTTGELVSGRAAQERARTVIRTGDLGTSLRSLAAGDPAASELQEQRLSSGAIKLDLRGRFRNFLYGEYRDDGSLIIRHRVEDAPDASGRDDVEEVEVVEE